MASKNITITVPNGTTYYQDPSQLCLPPSWTTIVTFFVANYVAHAATVRSTPAEGQLASFEKVFFCLFFPAFGLTVAMSMIMSCATFAAPICKKPTPESRLAKATRAGALIMVARDWDWEPQNGDRISYSILCIPVTSQEPGPGTY
jgi:hypothetical protein